MAQNWKYFISGLDSTNDIVKLRQIFKGKNYYLNGHLKGAKGVYVLKNLKDKEYGEKKSSRLGQFHIKNGLLSEKNEVTFWSPSCDRGVYDYSQYEIDTKRPKIVVTLDNDKVIKINPAAGEPKEMIFGGDYEEERLPIASLYSKSSEYGSLAYELIYLEDELAHEGGIMTNDKRVLKLVELALINSYDLPQDMLNWLSIISHRDIIAIYKAAMGASEHFLENLIGES